MLAARALVESILPKFGAVAFREGQLAAIEAVLQRRDVFVRMPTGFGKSSLYQIPAVATRSAGLPGRFYVISPLVSLMRDQVETLNARLGGPFACWMGEDPQVDEAAKSGAYGLVYLTPERLVDMPTGWGHTKDPIWVAVDEAHCVSEWGHDFREAYGTLRSSFHRIFGPDVCIIAVTATATRKIVDGVLSNLELKSPLVVLLPVDRPNLQYKVMRKESAAQDIMKLAKALKDVVGTSLVYVQTKKECSALARSLVDLGVSAAAYHAGLDVVERTATQRSFATGQVKTVVATIAFGMGIDRPDVRLVINYGAPTSLETLTQMTGRAGRDGLPARCVVMWGDKDALVASSVVAATENDRLSAVFAYLGDTLSCRRRALSVYFEGSETTCPLFCPNRDTACDACARREAVVANPPPSTLSKHERFLLRISKDAGDYKGGTHAVNLAAKQDPSLSLAEWKILQQRLLIRGLLETTMRPMRERKGQYVSYFVSAKGVDLLKS